MKPNKIFIISGRIALIFLLFYSLSCGKDDTTSPSTYVAPPPPPPTTPPPWCTANCKLLYYGGDYQDAPTIDAGAYEAAARFTPAKIDILVGKTIKEIVFFIIQKPDSIKLKLYGPLNEKTPGNLLYSADVTSTAEPSKWNVHTLTQPVVLKNEDIWLSIEFKLTSSRKTVGCDPGPAIIDGDWLYSSADSQWIAFNKRTGTSINWTLRLNAAL